MGVDVCVYDDNYNIIPKKYFIKLGFPSDNLRDFGISGGWVSYFEELVGITREKHNINYLAMTMKQNNYEDLNKWYNHILKKDRQYDIISEYLKVCIDENFTLVFW